MTTISAPDELAVTLPELIAAHDPDEILLFGSRAKNVARHDSDWDLLVLIPEERFVKQIDRPAHPPTIKAAGNSVGLVFSGSEGFHGVKHVANTLGREIGPDVTVLHRREGWIPPSVQDASGASTIARLHARQCRENLRAADILSSMPYGRRRQLHFAAGDLLTALATLNDVHFSRSDRDSLLTMAGLVPAEHVADLLPGLRLLERLETMDIEELAHWAGEVPDQDVALLDRLAEGLTRGVRAIELRL